MKYFFSQSEISPSFPSFSTTNVVLKITQCSHKFRILLDNVILGHTCHWTKFRNQYAFRVLLSNLIIYGLLDNYLITAISSHLIVFNFINSFRLHTNYKYVYWLIFRYIFWITGNTRFLPVRVHCIAIGYGLSTMFSMI